jgi:hypothetical protein
MVRAILALAFLVGMAWLSFAECAKFVSNVSSIGQVVERKGANVEQMLVGSIRKFKEKGRYEF